ncbi:MAG TPA: bifunctional demethylmenaquinone methyltransferase/2-methoxy-6-polyprenyl-1,4-benzoquinol methylase UbiE [Candidatus Dormibacteraeota bacterium]|nr:bifunctional demethylmenaquinone methyltransferase/2-methoxy-6-polyprenyl-1,4-benzoquinol methylase UbiE [Candidatus Dormibacteraeota bacterium]
MTDTLDGVEKARFVSAMFSRIARRYDLMNSLMTLGMHHAWRRMAARQTIASPEGPALDLATGTGDLALELAEVHPHRAVIAADFSMGMLAIARAKLRALEQPKRIRLMAADALALPFETRTFACVTSAFLLRNLADLEQGLREMRRVSRPGGRVVALEITQMSTPGFTALFRFYFHRVVPWVGQLVGGDREAYTYLPQSVDRFVTPTELARLMEKVGLRGVTYRRLGLGTVTVHTGIA